MKYGKKYLDHFVFEEGYRRVAYLDHKGNWTIGVGHMLPKGKNYSGVKLTDAQVISILEKDLDWCHDVATEVFGTDFVFYSENSQLAIIDMIFNLGRNGFLGFKNMIKFIKERNFDQAAIEALDSKWAKHDVPVRAKRTAELLKG